MQLNMKNSALIICGLLAFVQGRTFDTNFYKPRVVNGKDVKLGERPYQVVVHWPDYGFCGGTIINEYWILTAAHCVDAKVPESSWEIIADTVDLNEIYSTHKVVRKIVHEEWSERDSFKNDIALLKIATPLKFSFRIQPVILPKPHAKVKTNSSAVVSGWGFTSTAPISEILQKATIYIMDSEVCQTAVKDRNYTIHSTHVCANDLTTIVGPCDGDSGGPLTVDGVLMGIISWTVKILGCGTPRYPGVYTRVSEYVDWINEHIE